MDTRADEKFHTPGAMKDRAFSYGPRFSIGLNPQGLRTFNLTDNAPGRLKEKAMKRGKLPTFYKKPVASFYSAGMRK